MAGVLKQPATTAVLLLSQPDLDKRSAEKLGLAENVYMWKLLQAETINTSQIVTHIPHQL